MKPLIYFIFSCLVFGTSTLLAEDVTPVDFPAAEEQLIYDMISAVTTDNDVTKEMYQTQYRTQPFVAMSSVAGGIYEMYNIIDSTLWPDGYVTINQNGDNLILNWIGVTKGDQIFNVLVSTPLQKYRNSKGELFYSSDLMDINFGTYNMTGRFFHRYTKDSYQVVIEVYDCNGNYCPASMLSVGNQIW